MKPLRTSLLVVLTLGSSSAFADWTKVSRHEEKDATFYVDPSRIKEDGEVRRAWVAMDIGPNSKVGAGSSVVSLYEFKCKKDMSRIATSSSYSGHKGEGQLLASEKDGEWDYVQPDSIQDSILKFVCKVKIGRR